MQDLVDSVALHAMRIAAKCILSLHPPQPGIVAANHASAVGRIDGALHVDYKRRTGRSVYRHFRIQGLWVTPLACKSKLGFKILFQLKGP